MAVNVLNFLAWHGMAWHGMAFFCAHPVYFFSSHFFFSLSLPETDLGSGVTKEASPPPPHYGTRLHFYRDNVPAPYSLVDSTATL